MCTQPIYINPRQRLINEFRYKRMHQHFLSAKEEMSFLKKLKKYDTLLYSDLAEGFQVKCGHCSQCVLEKQNDYTQLLTRAAKDCECIAFFTLTYRNDVVPIAEYIPSEIDFESGIELTPASFKVTSGYKYRISSKNKDLKDYWNFLDKTRGSIVNVIGKKNHPVFLFGKYYIKSLYRKDVRYWLKRSRIMYERTYKRKMLPFKIFWTGEYGDVNGGPHYHLEFLFPKGSDMKEVRYNLAFLKRMWKNWYGIVGISKSCDNSLGIVQSLNGQIGVAQYISKYINKGAFSFEFLSYCEKPRIAISKNIVSLSPAEIKKYRAEDFLQNKGDVFNCDLSELETWKAVLDDRKFALVGLDGKVKRFPLGKHLRDRVFKEKVVTYEEDFSEFYGEVIRKKKIEYVPIALSAINRYFVRNDLLADGIRKQEEFESLASSLGYSKARAVQENTEKAAAQNLEKYYYSKLRENYRQSQVMD